MSYERTASAPSTEDRTETALRATAQNIIAVIFGLLPLFFIPVAFAPFAYTKIMFVIVGVLTAVIFYSLSVLRSGTFKISAPLALWGMWGIATAGIISALLSGDLNDALFGSTLGVHTAAFLIILALLATVTVIIGQSKATVMRLYLTLTVSDGLLTLFHVLRVLFGSDSLTLGVFTGQVSSPAGGWNDLGLLFGLIILLALVALEQLPLTKPGRIIFSLAIALSVLMLSVVNFSAIWIVLALVSLVVLMYGLTKDRFSKQVITTPEPSSVSIASIMLSTGVFVISLLFIIGGPTVGSFMANLTNISYIEVRPSFEATLDVARGVYAENALVGIGPNRFSDAWRLFKDPSINQTIFWETEFAAGSGYIPTQFITTGVLGAVAWVIFFALLLRAGFRMLFISQTGDRFWYFIGSSSFVAAVYLWGMSFVYVPGPTILLLAGIFTSIVFVAYTAMLPTKAVSISVASNRRSAIVLVGIVMVIIVASASTLYLVGRHYSAVYAFNAAISSVSDGTPLEEVEQQIAAAYATSQNDLYARQLAQYQVAKLNSLLNLAEPTAVQQQQFQQAAANGLNAIQLALQTDGSDSRNHATQGAIYSVLAATGVEEAAERAEAAFDQAIRFDPLNPAYPLLKAQVRSRAGDLEGARVAALEAVRLKGNYTEALFLLTQLEIAAGNVAEAIQATEAMVGLEPNNAGRIYQLGVLYSSNGDIDQSIAAFERAITLDEDYANARYFLALAYAESGRIDDAITQLEVVRDLNPDNAGVQSLIDQLQSGATIPTTEELPEPVTEPEGVATDESTVTTTEELDTPLVTPVNTVPEEETTDTPTTLDTSDETEQPAESDESAS